MKKIISILLVSVLTLTCLFSLRLSFAAAESDEPTASGASQYAQDTIQGGAILHCFCWTYNQIKQHLPEIYAAGYTAVQTSPVQTPKDFSTSYLNDPLGSVWWKFYQPFSLSIADGNTWLGTKTQLQSLCTEADRYNIKVIVDIVANHVANKGPEGGGYANVPSGVEQSLQNAAYYHTGTAKVSSESRQDLTQNHIGMPDLNTGNTYIQTRVLDLLKDCVDLGVDGFRFDAAKHIETPNDAASFCSNFWPTVINGIKAYKSDVYCYGEVLGGAGTDFNASNYTTYMNVTEDVASNNARNAAKNGNAASLSNFYLDKEELPSQAVMWAESHDNYMDNTTSGISDAIITKTWAITGSRNDVATLFLARPGSKVGVEGDTSWKSTEIAEINKFKNYFDGQSEYLSSSGSVAYNERGTAGVSIAKLNGAGAVSLPAHTMAAGTYTDQITGNIFTVSGGVISGTVGSSGVAVVYNAPGDQPEPVTVDIGDANTDGNINVKDVTALQRYIAYLQEPDDTQYATADCDTDGDLTIADVTLLQRYLAEFTFSSLIGTPLSTNSTNSSGSNTNTNNNTSNSTQTSVVSVPSSTAQSNDYTFTFTNSQYWSGTISCYYWSSINTSMIAWPGKAMTFSETNSYGQKIYTVTVPADADSIIFSNGSSQTVNISISTARRYYATSNTDASGHYLVGTW